MDGCLRALGSLGRHQVLQLMAIELGSVGAAYQLMGNIFIGRDFSHHQCSRPDNDTATVTSPWPHDVMWNSSDVEFGQCDITVSSDNSSSEDSRVYPCVFGYTYDFERHLSFRTEFDLVCDQKLLGSLVQTLVILGQAFGAIIASIISDRYGRKPVLVASQLAMVTLGLAVAFMPSYAGLAVLKFLLGVFQQGVITTKATLSLEWLPAEQRSLISVMNPTAWSLCMMSMSLIAFLMSRHSWRHLQIALSLASVPVFLFQLWFVDESPRWLMANNKRDAAMRVLRRAARTNGKDADTVLQSMPGGSAHQELEVLTKDDQKEAETSSSDMTSEIDDVEVAPAGRGEEQASKKLTLLDLFRHRRLLLNSVIMWAAWFACAFAFFALYMMSTSLHGNRFLNYFLTGLVELIPGFIFYLMVDRVGRKLAIRPMFAVAGVGLISSGVCRIFTDSAALRTMSVVTSMLGMLGASGMFSAMFFYTPECFPTNIRNQALGVSSFASRFGGMMSPFMVDLAEVAVWAPGAIIGTVCFLVVALMHFLPETKGRELPDTVQDIERWYHPLHKAEDDPPPPKGQSGENNTDTQGSLTNEDPSSL